MSPPNEVTVVIRSYEEHTEEWWQESFTEFFRYLGLDAEIVELESEEV